MSKQFRLLAAGCLLVAGTAAVALSATAGAAPRATNSATTQVIGARWSCKQSTVSGRHFFTCSIAAKRLQLNPGIYLITPGLQSVTGHNTEWCSSSNADGVTYLSESINNSNEALVQVGATTAIQFVCETFRSGINYQGALEVYSATPVTFQT